MDPALVLERIETLRGGRPFGVHLYTAWSWHNQLWLDQEVDRYAAAGLSVTLTVKYSPPAGHDGDVDGYVGFVRDLVRHYARNAAVARYVVGNEPNVDENPDASDGPFRNVRDAVVRGVIAAREELDMAGSAAEVGFNLAITGADADAAFLKNLAERGGPRFRAAVGFVGIDVYPGLWPVGSDDPYADMVEHLANSREALAAAGFRSDVKLDILENGFPTPDERDQADRLTAMVQAVLDHYQEYGVVSYSWFDLWDADSGSASRFGHYGLLRSDLTPKPAFERYRALVQHA